MAAACGAGNAGNTAPPIGDADAGISDGGTDASDGDDMESADGNAPHAPTLEMSLDPALDGDEDDLKVSTIVTARLLDAKGVVAGDATISERGAVFDLSALPPGEYFVEVNSDADDLVPVRIDDPAKDIVQTVGQKLRASYVGPASGGHAYRIKTYSAGQDQPAVVNFSDGLAIPGEHPYVIITLAESKVETRVLGTGVLLTSFVPHYSFSHGSGATESWVLNAPNKEHHGDVFQSDGGASVCGSCHWDYWMKKPAYVDITPSRGWCFACHNGIDGDSSGFVDPTR